MSSTLPLSLVKEYKPEADVFIETGTHQGWGIDVALEAGFSEIHSIELDEQSFKTCTERFKDKKGVHIYHGSSEDLLTDVYNSVVTEKPVLFWLDGHTPNLPLYSELEQISKFERKNHIILIDDLRCIIEVDPNLEKIKQHLLAINPNYKIFRVDSAKFANDILVAKQA
jgi:hypothetical protein